MWRIVNGSFLFSPFIETEVSHPVEVTRLDPISYTALLAGGSVLFVHPVVIVISSPVVANYEVVLAGRFLTRPYPPNRANDENQRGANTKDDDQ
ncbi:hypothetical protein Bolokhovo_4 [Bacillus phage Bolokhovo]|uniref:Uncharacterized protein n=1 Tax=Bacillus phage Bolokhovo TaxID=2743970 RepID=A0A7D7PIQ2_9CAUD|nr:hypothetical protein Bolokhovo_4 [Bacillus phage Bolokhovo]